jgi:hypothetical protein
MGRQNRPLRVALKPAILRGRIRRIYLRPEIRHGERTQSGCCTCDYWAVRPGVVVPAEVARELGINANQLHRWKRQLAEDGEIAFPEKGRLTSYYEYGARSRGLPPSDGRRSSRFVREPLNAGIAFRGNRSFLRVGEEVASGV